MRTCDDERRRSRWVVSTRRVLVAEDDQHVREALERALRFEGYAVITAADGAAALAAVDDDEPDVIALDVSMPLVDGLSVCRRLRARGDITVDGEGHRLVVSDHGPGIPPDERDHVFDRFYRIPSARSTGGSGLGLAIVRQIAEQHGGTAFAGASEEGGAEVGFTVLRR
jgi:hypothetical protein